MAKRSSRSSRSSSTADPTSFQYFSSGSEHDGDYEDDSLDGRDLSDLVRSFIEEEHAGATTRSSTTHHQHQHHSDSDEDHHSTNPISDLEDLLIKNNHSDNDSFLLILRSLVSKAVETFDNSRFLSRSNSDRRRCVMTFLRNSGINAGICKSKWESSGGLAAGNYEFIDVVCTNLSSFSLMRPRDHERIGKRYIVDLDFTGEFVIARPTSQYTRLIQQLPRVFVGRSEEMKKIIRLMCDEAKRSLKSRELTLPPWRKNRYMQTKWFGPYRRTVNQTASSPSVKSSDSFSAVKCRAVGFDAVCNGDGRFALPATTRTRLSF
ncbi:hypothetical protein Sjap_005995 [Stephania japonica]|uniref:Uncharacterized protein n=1 Tax=Stephania japonica TaxID=461633 RepID=A0AAP0PJB8_9MAGN